MCATLVFGCEIVANKAATGERTRIPEVPGVGCAFAHQVVNATEDNRIRPNVSLGRGAKSGKQIAESWIPQLNDTNTPPESVLARVSMS